MVMRDAIYQSLAARTDWPRDRNEAMSAVVDALWDSLSQHGVSWVGFYLDDPGASDDQKLILGPRRDKPACSPIGLHGVCGQSFRNRATRIVSDVADLGTEYIACDPRDRSEIVIPMVDAKGTCWGVLDLDSWEVDCFGKADDEGLRSVLGAAGILPSRQVV